VCVVYECTVLVDLSCMASLSLSLSLSLSFGLSSRWWMADGQVKREEGLSTPTVLGPAQRLPVGR